MKRGFLSIVCAMLLGSSAIAQTVQPGGFVGGETALYATGTIVGNGADTTLDTLQTFTLPASSLNNVGDAIHIVAGGTLASSTDTKNIKLLFGAQVIASLSGATTTATSWAFDVWVVKTGSNAQSIQSMGTVISSANAAGTGSTTTTLVDTGALAVTVQGQNATAATANTANCRTFLVSRRAAPGMT